MSRDRSLDEFATSAAEEAEDAAVDEGAEVDERASESETEADERTDETETGNGESGMEDRESGSAAPVDADHDEPGEQETDEPGEQEVDENEVEPAATTYRWDPEGVACTECGTVVERLWSQEGGQVCADCKEW